MQTVKPQFLLTRGTPEPSDYEEIKIEERYMRPTAEYPDGSWLHKVGDRVEVATGYFAKEYPDKPSPYWHGGAPFVMISIYEWPWKDWKKRGPDGTV